MVVGGNEENGGRCLVCGNSGRGSDTVWAGGRRCSLRRGMKWPVHNRREFPDTPSPRDGRPETAGVIDSLSLQSWQMSRATGVSRNYASLSWRVLISSPLIATHTLRYAVSLFPHHPALISSHHNLCFFSGIIRPCTHALLMLYFSLPQWTGPWNPHG